MATQRTEGEGKEPEHTHPARTHSHDRYYVSHHHAGGIRVVSWSGSSA